MCIYIYIYIYICRYIDRLTYTEEATEMGNGCEIFAK